MPAGGGPDGQRRLPPAFSSGTRWRAGAFRGGRVVSGAEMKSSRAGTLTARPRVLSPQVHGPACRPPAPVAVRAGPARPRRGRSVRRWDGVHGPRGPAPVPVRAAGPRPRAKPGAWHAPWTRSRPQRWEASRLLESEDMKMTVCVWGGHVFIGVL